MIWNLLIKGCVIDVISYVVKNECRDTATQRLCDCSNTYTNPSTALTYKHTHTHTHTHARTHTHTHTHTHTYARAKEATSYKTYLIVFHQCKPSLTKSNTHPA